MAVPNCNFSDYWESWESGHHGQESTESSQRPHGLLYAVSAIVSELVGSPASARPRKARPRPLSLSPSSEPVPLLNRLCVLR
jgi:hypothetical protein